MITTLQKNFPIIRSNPYAATFFGVSIGTFVLGVLLFASLQLFSGVSVVKADASKWVPPTGNSIMEVHVANNGMTLIKGARVVSVDGVNITVETSWNTTKLQWTIRTDEAYYDSRHFGTSFLNSKGDRLAIQNIHVGSIVGISGLLDINATQPTVKAEVIKIAD